MLQIKCILEFVIIGVRTLNKDLIGYSRAPQTDLFRFGEHLVYIMQQIIGMFALNEYICARKIISILLN